MKTKFLMEICSPKQWKTISMGMLTKDGYPVYGANGIIGKYSEYNHDKRTLLITCRGATCGTLNICEPYSYVTGNAMALDDLIAEIELDYLYYYLLFRGFEDIITGSAQPQIVRSSLNNISITYPDLSDQHKIVATLDQVNDLISIKNQQLEQLDLLIKSRFVEMFGDLANPLCAWEKRIIVDCCKNSDDIKCGPFGTQLNKEEYTSSGVAVWEIAQINSNFTEQPVHYVSTEKAERLKAYSIIAGDIAMSRKGNVGKCAVFPNGFSNGIIHSDVLRIRFDSTICNSIFMLCQLHFSKHIINQIKVVSSGSIMAGINVTKLKKIEIFLPPLALQTQFADFVTKVEKQKTTVKQSLEELGTLKASLMQKYFG